jgi:hypothetical protein
MEKAPTLFDLALSWCRIDERNNAVENMIIQALVKAGESHCQRFTGWSLTPRDISETVTLQRGGMGMLSKEPAGEVSVFSLDGNFLGRIRADGRNIAALPNDYAIVFTETDGADRGRRSRFDRVVAKYSTGSQELELDGHVIGILKYVAYQYEHRGDEGNVNNGALSKSGALDEWRPFMRVLA